MTAPRKTIAPPKEAAPVDLSDYEEERLPFDAVIRKLGRAKAPESPEPVKPKAAKKASRKRG